MQLPYFKGLVGVYFISIIPAFLILIALWLVYLALCYTRTRLLPHCWKCGAAKVRRSQLHGVLDRAAAISLLLPLRCSGCRSRFYVLRTLRAIA